MHAKEFGAYGFMKFVDGTTAKFPDTGIVVITGHNGACKSAIVEAFSVGAYGKTLRGTPAWRKDEPGLLQIRFDGMQVNRKKPKNGAIQLQYGPDDGELSDYTTAMKSQHSLQDHLPPFDSWRRTSVFLARDAGTFTMATDAQRKTLIEDLTDAVKFGPALQAARADHKEVRKKIDRITRNTAVLQERIAGLDQRLMDLKQDVASVEIPDDVDPEALQGLVWKYEAFIEKAKRDERTARTALVDVLAGVTDAQAAQRAASNAVKRLDVDECPSCGQDIPVAMVERLETELEVASTILDAKRAEAAGAKEQTDAELDELGDEIETFEEKLRLAKAELRLAKETIVRIVKATKIRNMRGQALEDCFAAHDDATGELAEEALDLGELRVLQAELQACEVVLGLQGVRAHILGGALTGIEALSNAWLSKIGWPGLQVSMKPYTESDKKDGVTDKISLKMDGAGGGYGYLAASTGEKSRIDIAILFAFAEYAAAAQGVEPGTLWLDEVMDGLDDDGVDAVSDVLQTISQNRLVVVISHRQELCDALRPAQHLHVNAGTITDVGTSTRKAS